VALVSDAGGAGPEPTREDLEAIAQEIRRAIRGMRYGSVEITIHDGKVVQIERKEKVRLGTSRPGGAK
jgi:hypothetical protein